MQISGSGNGYGPAYGLMAFAGDEHSWQAGDVFKGARLLPARVPDLDDPVHDGAEPGLGLADVNSVQGGQDRERVQKRQRPSGQNQGPGGALRGFDGNVRIQKESERDREVAFEIEAEKNKGEEAQVASGVNGPGPRGSGISKKPFNGYVLAFREKPVNDLPAQGGERMLRGFRENQSHGQPPSPILESRDCSA